MEITELGDFDGIVEVNGESVKFTVEGGLLNCNRPTQSNTEQWEILAFLRKDKDVLNALLFAMSYF